MSISFINNMRINHENTKHKKIIEGMGVCVMGMGDCGTSVKSTVKIENDVTQIDKNSLEITNQQLNTLISNEMQKSAQNCKAGTYNSSDIEISDLQLEGDFNLDGTQSNESFIDLKCAQMNEVKSSVSREIMSSMMNDLATNKNQEALAAMTAAAATKSETQAGSGLFSAPPDVDANVELKNKYMQLSETEKKLVNVVANTTEKNFNSETLQECVANAVQSNGVRVKGVSSRTGGANIVLSQKNASKIAMDCVQKTNVANQITEGIVSNLGVKVVDTTSQASKFAAEAKAETDAKGGGLTQIFDSIGGIFSSLFGAYAKVAMFAVIGCVAISFIVFLVMKYGNPENIKAVGKVATDVASMASPAGKLSGITDVALSTLSDSSADNGADNGDEGEEDGQEGGKTGGTLGGFLYNLVNLIACK